LGRQLIEFKTVLSLVVAKPNFVVRIGPKWPKRQKEGEQVEVGGNDPL